MSKIEEVIEEMNGLPDPALAEVLDFLKHLKARVPHVDEATILAETSLRKDWLKPDEDAAWQHL